MKSILLGLLVAVSCAGPSLAHGQPGPVGIMRYEPDDAGSPKVVVRTIAVGSDIDIVNAITIGRPRGHCRGYSYGGCAKGYAVPWRGHMRYPSKQTNAPVIIYGWQ